MTSIESTMLIVGTIVAVFTIIMYLPQVYKVVKTNTTSDLKKSTYLTIYFACIILSIWSSIIGQWPSFISNITVSWFMIIISYFLFRNNKFAFIFLLFVWILGLAFSIVLLVFYEFEDYSIISTILSIIAGAMLGSAFFPQTFQIIKTKSIGHISIGSTILLILGNLLWSIYWILNIVNEEFSAIPQLIFSITIVFLQIPILYFHFPSKKNKI